jgi:uncharacterized protein YndB with AHSA1/START domain
VNGEAFFLVKRSIIIRFAILFALTTGLALAVDVTGKWSGEMGGPDGGGMSITFTFKQDGTRLTGTADGPGGQPLQIKDGKVEGDKISFTLSFEGGGGDMKIVHEGSVNGDEMTLNIKMDGGPGGGPVGPLKLKRTK